MAKASNAADLATEQASQKAAETVALAQQPKRAATPASETIRIECLKLAVEMRSAAKPTRSLITEAKDFEAYVTGVTEQE